MKLITGPVPFVAWRCITLILVILAVAAALLVLHWDAYFLPSGVAQGLIGALSLAAWVAAIRFILCDTWGRWFWAWMVDTTMDSRRSSPTRGA